MRQNGVGDMTLCDNAILQAKNMRRGCGSSTASSILAHPGPHSIWTAAASANARLVTMRVTMTSE
jgi:hypothetical protein